MDKSLKEVFSDKYNPDILKNIVFLLDKYNLSQRDFARILQLGENSISDFFAGRRKPTIYIILRFADFFALSIDWLTGRDSIISTEHILRAKEDKMISTLKLFNLVEEKDAFGHDKIFFPLTYMNSRSLYYSINDRVNILAIYNIAVYKRLSSIIGVDTAIFIDNFKTIPKKELCRDTLIHELKYHNDTAFVKALRNIHKQ